MVGTLRRCIGCGRSEPKAGLLRFTLGPGGPEWDEAHAHPGRGAYVHPTVVCWTALGDIGRWRRAFRGKGPQEREPYVAAMDAVRGCIPGLVDRSGAGQGPARIGPRPGPRERRGR